MAMLSIVSQLHPWTNEDRNMNKVVSQTFCYTSYLTSSYKAAPKQTIQHLKQVTFTIYCIWLATNKTKNNTHINLALTDKYNIEQEHNYGYNKPLTDLTVKMISYIVIQNSKAQPCITRFPTYATFSMAPRAIIFLMSVNEEINKSLNFLPHQHLIFKAKFHEDITNALQPAHPGSGCNIFHANLYKFTQNQTVTKD